MFRISLIIAGRKGDVLSHVFREKCVFKVSVSLIINMNGTPFVEYLKYQ